MVCETFIHRHSVIHRLDPRSRVMAAVLWSVLLAVSQRFQSLLMGVLAAVAVTLLARLEWRPLLRRLVTVNCFMLFVLGTLPFAIPGQPLFTIGPWPFSDTGLERAAMIALKGNTIVLMLTTFLGTIELGRLGQTMRMLGAPDKLTHLFLFTVRYLDMLHHEYHRLANAMRVRCFVPHFNVVTCRAYGYLVGMLLVRSIDRSERVLAAMRCRGFRGRFHSLDRFAFGVNDLAFGVITVVVLIATGWLEWQTTGV